MIGKMPYLLEASLILAGLHGWYFYILRNQKTFVVNRMFLWAIMIATCAIPLLSFEVLLETLPTTMDMIVTKQSNDDFGMSPMDWLNVVNLGVMIIYWIGFFFHLTRLCISLFSILKLLNGDDYQKYLDYNLKIIPEIACPSSFLNYIFLPTKDIEPTIIQHELVHVKARHSIDILTIKFFKAIFWFHPSAYHVEQLFKENHEYYCDHQIVDNDNVSTYLALMLEYSKNNTKTDFLHSFSSFTKKRITMITQSSTPRSNFIKLIFSVVFFASIFALFSFDKYSNVPQNPNNINKVDTIKPISNPVIDISSQFDHLSDQEIIKRFNKEMMLHDTIVQGDQIKIVSTEPFIESYRILVNRERRKANPDQEKIGKYLDLMRPR
jgi:hypothetical protein